MSFSEAIGTVSAVLEVVTKIGGDDHEPGRRAARFRPLIIALRQIYFTPRSTQRILEKLAVGEDPDRNDVEKILPEFNDAEWRVERALGVFDPDELEYIFDLSLKKRRIFNEIAYGKRNLRKEIQNALNEPLTFGKTVSKSDASILLKKVQALNAVIEALEEELL